MTKPKIGTFPNKIRVTAFVNFCKSYGCDERDLFRTVYLTEPKDQKDLDAVVRTLENLSSLIDSKGGNQPSLIGIKGRKCLVPSKNKGNTGDYDSYGIVKHAKFGYISEGEIHLYSHSVVSHAYSGRMPSLCP